MAKLTPKQEAFAKAYIETGNASEAYRRSYDAGKMKPATVNRKAVELLENGKITARLAELQSGHQKRHEITVDSITTMLADAYALAMKPEVTAVGAAVSAALGLAKLHGHIIDSKNVNLNANHKHHHTVEPLSESAHWLARVLGSGTDSEAAQPLH
jgi:hypothetical protein